MPPLERMDLTEYAVMWEASRYGRDGFQVVLSPVQLRVRWEETNFDRMDANGHMITIDVVIASTQNIPIGSLMWEGKLADLSGMDTDEEVGTGSLIPDQDLYEVVFRVRAKDLKGRITRYEFGLKRYKDTLPSVV